MKQPFLTEVCLDVVGDGNQSCVEFAKSQLHKNMASSDE